MVGKEWVLWLEVGTVLGRITVVVVWGGACVQSGRGVGRAWWKVQVWCEWEEGSNGWGDVVLPEGHFGNVTETGVEGVEFAEGLGVKDLIMSWEGDLRGEAEWWWCEWGVVVVLEVLVGLLVV